MRWDRVQGRGDMFVRPPLPDWMAATRSTIPLYGMGQNANEAKFHYQLPNAMQQWGWGAQARAMQEEDIARLMLQRNRRDQPPAPRMGPPNPGLDRLVASMARMERPPPRAPASVVFGGGIRHLPPMPVPERLPRRR